MCTFKICAKIGKIFNNENSLFDFFKIIWKYIIFVAHCAPTRYVHICEKY